MSRVEPSFVAALTGQNRLRSGKTSSIGRTILLSLLLSLTIFVGFLASQDLLDSEVIEENEWEEDAFEEMLVSASPYLVLAYARRLLSKEETLSFLVSISPPDQPPKTSPAF